MRLTSFTDYSLRVLIYLAAVPGRRATIAEIAASFRVSENHLTKVVHHLGKKGWITTARGKGGGIGLARAAEAMSVDRIVRDTEGEVAAAECFEAGGGDCAIADHCRLRGVLDEAVRAFHAVLDRYTLADLAREGPVLAGILHIPRPVTPIRRLP